MSYKQLSKSEAQNQRNSLRTNILLGDGAVWKLGACDGQLVLQRVLLKNLLFLLSFKGHAVIGFLDKRRT